VNAMLTDEDLTRLLEEAAGSYPVPEPDLALPEESPKPVWLRRGPQLGAAAAASVVALALLLQGGGGGGSPSAKSSLAGASVDRAAPTEAYDSGGTTGGALGPVAGPAPVPQQLANGSVKSPAVAGTGSSAGTAEGQDSARVVKTGTISLVVDEGKVSATVKRLQVLVATARGYIADSTSDEAGKHPSASLTVRVPVASFEQLIDQVRGLPVKVVSAAATGKDVTASYADTKAQIQSLTAARNRYLDILSRAKTIGETLTVQQRVDDVQQQIDRLEGQRRVLADQSDYGTLTISVADQADQEALITKEPSGWSKAWHDATHGFTSGVQRLIAGSGRTLLVLLVGAALLLLGRTGWRLARRRLV
jgi:hypothetical protein